MYRYFLKNLPSLYYCVTDWISEMNTEEVTYPEMVKNCASNAQAYILTTKCNDPTGYLTCKTP